MQLDPACAPPQVARDVPQTAASLSADSPVVSVSQLLAEARVHEANRTRAANQLTGKQHTPHYSHATIAAQMALDKRLQAHALDPEHTDPAWALDKAPHQAIVDFLTAYIPRP